MNPDFPQMLAWRVWREWCAVALMAFVPVCIGIIQERVHRAAPAIAQVVAGSLCRTFGDDITWYIGPGDGIAFGDILRSHADDKAAFVLVDGSRADAGPQSDFSLESERGGIRVRLVEGRLLVNVHSPHFSILTKDAVISGAGRFLVNEGENGTRVSVSEGEVHVVQGSSEKRLRAGEEFVTTPLLENPL